MASSKKRKAEAAVDEAGEDGIDAGGEDKVVKKRRVRRKPRKKTPSLIMSLPGELRNKIYALALDGPVRPIETFRKGNRIRVGSDWFSHEPPLNVIRLGRPTSIVESTPPNAYGETFENRSRVTPLWRQPGLLQASKQVREESMYVYYSINTFRLVVDPTRIPQAVEWLRCFYARYGTELFERVSFAMIVRDWRSNIEFWFSIARLVYDATARSPSQTAERRLWADFFGDLKGSSEFAVSIRTVVASAVKAKWRKTPYSSFQEDYIDWAFEKLRTENNLGSRFWSQANQERLVRDMIRAAMKRADPDGFAEGAHPFDPALLG
ncbi:uncharacterized protein LTR77_005802 [Saxophila tyrrhenica]|uniref:Uncharacterized protein n=1 Tax=Saxophila tyrrhenica TaxID=1690608 RepID=A0AAV9PCZ5_9PEZI|nr:hypothetical protein LTR77_005802 [Saxophila tyrrhenica]